MINWNIVGAITELNNDGFIYIKLFSSRYKVWNFLIIKNRIDEICFHFWKKKWRWKQIHGTGRSTYSRSVYDMRIPFNTESHQCSDPYKSESLCYSSLLNFSNIITMYYLIGCRCWDCGVNFESSKPDSPADINSWNLWWIKIDSWFLSLYMR